MPRKPNPPLMRELVKVFLCSEVAQTGPLGAGAHKWQISFVCEDAKETLRCSSNVSILLPDLLVLRGRDQYLNSRTAGSTSDREGL